MVLAPGSGKVIIGGRFGKVNNAAQRGLAALDPTTGAMLPWAAPATIKNGLSTGSNSGKAGIWALSTDGVSVFGTGWVFADAATGNLEGSFSAAPDSGNINWIEDCHGDRYGAYSDRTNVYVIGHPHDCVTVGTYPQANPAPGNLRHSIAFTAAAKGVLGHTPTAGAIYTDWGGSPAPAAIDWYPDWVTGSATGQGQAGWTITGSGKLRRRRWRVPLCQWAAAAGSGAVRPSRDGAVERGAPLVRDEMGGNGHLAAAGYGPRDDPGETGTVTI